MSVTDILYKGERIDFNFLVLNISVKPKECSVQIMLKWALGRNVEKLGLLEKTFNAMLCYFHLSVPNTSSLWGIFICPDCIVGLQTEH